MFLSEFFNANVVTFEPDPQAFRICEEKLFQKPNPAVEVKNIALSNVNQNLPLYLYELGSSSFHQLKGFKSPKKIIVRANRFDSLNINHPELLVMDAQGHEGEILMGFGSGLNKISYICFEVSLQSNYMNKLNFTAIHRLLARNGFRFVASSSSGKGIVRFWLTSIRSMFWSLRNSRFRNPFHYQSFTDVLYKREK